MAGVLSPSPYTRLFGYVSATGPIGPQTSTSATVVVAGAELDATFFNSISYTFIAATHDVDVSVFGANQPDYSDEVAVYTATKVAAGATGSYTQSPTLYRYYRVKVIDDVGGTHGTVNVSGVAK